MARRRGTPATYDDILKLPEHVIGEILGGELIVSPRPTFAHGQAALTIGHDLFWFNGPLGGGGRGGWWIAPEPELHLHGDVVVPDLAGWRRERMPRPPASHEIELAPDWVCEIASPSTARHDRSRKMPIYAREKVQHIWITDPAARTLEVFRREDDKWLLLVTHGEDTPERVRVEPFEAIEIELARWWIEQESGSNE